MSASSRIRDHIRSNVIGYIALFVALGGSAGALNGTNTVFSDDIARNQVKGWDADEATFSATPLRTRVAQGGCRPAVRGTGRMLKVGSVCIDKFEASVWSAPNGGTRYGVSSDNYPCNDNGQNCKGKIFARSVGGVKPSAFITWFQAQQALANSQKRLPTSAEWQTAVAGTPDPGPDNGTTDCNTTEQSGQEPVNTGSRPGCVSAHGANDMVGNLREWVADWVPTSTECAGWGSFSNDAMCLSGASTTAQGPGALIRGGSFFNGTNAGPFAVNGLFLPSNSFFSFGFRGVR